MVFAIHWHESAMGVHPECPSHLPPQPNPLGCLRALALGAPLQASNLHWSSLLHMVIYMFHAILSNHPTLAFSHSVQKSVLYICVSFAVLHYRVIVNDLSKFHIYALNMFLDRTTVWKERKKGQELGRSSHLTTLATCFVSCYCWIVFPIKVKFYDIFKISYHTSITAFILVVHSALFLSRWIIYDDNQRLSSVRSFMLFFGREQFLPWERHRQGPRWG